MELSSFFLLAKSPRRLILCSMFLVCLVTGFIILIQIQFLKFRGVKLSFQNFVFQTGHDHNLVSFKEAPSEITFDLEFDHVDEHIALHELKGDEKRNISGSVIHINQNIDPKSVVIGCAVTSRNRKRLTDLPLIQQLLPSFCKTASQGWKYQFYLSHDHNDALFADTNQHKEFENQFFKIIREQCKGIFVKLHFVRCIHSGNPAWAQNDAIMEGYIDNHAYFYRVNDDTIIKDSGWTEAFTDTLAKYDPPNVGVVGPQHQGGNMAILTYDFTHHTHITVFGFHYPRGFTDWYADDWVTKVYRPGRSAKLSRYRLLHTLKAGTRYEVHMWRNKYLTPAINNGKRTLQRYIKAVKAKDKAVVDGKKVISMSLYGGDGCYLWGAIRNAQTVPVYFPGWTLRVYVAKPHPDGKIETSAISPRIINKLQTLGAQIAYVDMSMKNIAPVMWRYLVADDIKLDYFIVRDADSRLSDRDAFVVKEWMKSGKAVHCIRDHPNHANYSMLGGLWGGKPKELLNVFRTSFQDMLQGYSGSNDKSQDIHFLTQFFWPKMQHLTYCHDSISCQKYDSSHPFPVERSGQEHVGQTFDMFGEANENDINVLRKTPKVKECTDVSSILPGPIVQVSSSNLPPAKLSKIDKDVIIWSADLRIGPVRDIRNILEPAGVRFIDKSLSPNCHRTKSCATGLKVITPNNILESNPAVIEQFYTSYKTDPEMQMVTHYLCSYPAANCELYMKFGKPMLVLASGRYEYGRLQTKAWKRWNQSLREIQSGPKNLVAATNLYDQAYIKYYTGIQPEVIPSLCSYVNTVYSSTNNRFLLTSLTVPEFQKSFLKNFEVSRKTHGLNVILHAQSDKWIQYSFEDLAKYKAIIYIPHDVFSIYLCEMYQMNVPIFAPSLKLLVDIWQKDSKILTSRTLNTLRNLLKTPLISGGSGSDPNNESDLKTVKEWVNLSDIYHYKHIVLFDSIDDLVRKLKTQNLQNISKQMKETNIKRRKEILEKWKTVLQRTAGVSTSIS